MVREDDSDDDWDDEEEPDEDDGDDTVPCPYCRRPIHEDAQRCPYCENYISEEDAPPGRKPTWVVVGAVICLLIAVMWVLGG